MKIFFDHCVDRRLSRLLPEHEVWTAYKKGWSALKNGELLLRVEAEFEVFLTIDQNLRYQQNLSRRSLKFIVLVAQNNQYETLAPLIPKVKEALTKMRSGELIEVS